MSLSLRPFPPRFSDLKKELSAGNEESLTKAWNEVLAALKERTAEIAQVGTEIIPQVDFTELATLSPEQLANIRRGGCVIIRNIVDDAEARGYQDSLKEYIQANPDVNGFPEGNKQFFEMYWSTSQLRSRSHPNVNAAGTFLNNLWHSKEDDVVDLNTNLSYADRFRIRHPSPNPWNNHQPHIDGAGIERWEEPVLRETFTTIYKGQWQKYDPYDISGRLTANTDMYNRPNQASVFRSHQGWLAMAEIAPGNGTIQFFPDTLLSSAYIMLRPFFKPVDANLTGDAYLDASNWVFDTSDPTIHGIGFMEQGYFTGIRPTPASHPHFKLETSMVSIPRVLPGDMVFWHCDLIHSVEQYHTGPEDSSVIYIPAVPLTPQNARYLARHREHFLKRIPAPDFPQGVGEASFAKRGEEADIAPGPGRLAMGFEPFVAAPNATKGAREAVRIANEELGFA